MISSMIVFSCKEFIVFWGILFWELCLVNYCYLEILLCLLDILCDFENLVWEVLCKVFSCGKVECILKIKVENIIFVCLDINEEFVK